jgi:hypothetical protein
MSGKGPFSPLRSPAPSDCLGSKADDRAPSATMQRCNASITNPIRPARGGSFTISGIGSPRTIRAGRPLRVSRRGLGAGTIGRWRDAQPRRRSASPGRAGRGRHRRPTAIIGTASANATGWRNRKFADSPLEGDGFELLLKIQPKENCGFPGLAIRTIVPQTGAK